jgi:hypothetical protein
MKWLKRGGLVLAALLAAAPGALANDSTAELRTGGLVLSRNAAVEMRSEDLFISPSEVRVRYRFMNTTPRNVTVTVAFPMPDITIEGEDDMISIPTQDPQNFLDFHTTVDGAPVRAQVEQRVFKGAVEHTALLRQMGVPLAPHLPGTMAALDRLPRAQQDRLVALHLAYRTEWDSGQGVEHHLQPTWTLRTNYFWTQTFPAGREVAVEHRYRPSLGASAGTSMGSDWFRRTAEYRERLRHYCIDADFIASVDRARRRAGEETAPLVEERLEYILVTGANWARPIGDFRMVIDKGRADAIVSFCGTGVRRISPTQFEVRYRNFTPRQNVSVLILRPPNDPER